MEAPRLERKLVAILAADVEGYSRHMERDEAATLATLSAHRVIVDELDRLPPWPHHQHGRRQRAGGVRQRRRSCRLRGEDPGRAGRGKRGAAGRASPAVSHRHQCRRRHGQGRRHLRRRRQHRRPARSAGRGGRHLRLARRARPCAQDGPLRLRGSGRAERQEHRPADPRLSPARRGCHGSASTDSAGGCSSGGRRPLRRTGPAPASQSRPRKRSSNWPSGN